jgi:leucyl-tRNA synthetase
MAMDFREVEIKWQKFWEEHSELYRADDKSTTEKMYVLVEFPYPSGSGLHVGHAFSFTGGDVYARYQRMKGKNVLFPMGWDAFGLPTENYAIKMKRRPQEVTKENTDTFKSQMKKLAFSFDWSREVNTTEPEYYKWTQWIFIQLFKKGLAYKKEMPINWCPSCKIGLANEEVVNEKCERCGSEVSRRNISQWVVKITDYADKLIEGLKDTEFIEKVKQSQINWIGKSEGAKLRFKIVGGGELEVFTTRPDTLPGVTFMVIAPEHELVKSLKSKVIKDYVNITRKRSEMERAELNKEKTGVFSGLLAVNPFNSKEIPIWISDFVLSSYGTGAIMAVPAHDQRDHAFAKKFGLPIVPVIKKENWDFEDKALTEVEKDEEFEKMLQWIEEKGIGERANSYHLRDWIFSRQHYWGEPIPMVYCEKCGWQPVPEEQLPVTLPEVEAYEPSDDGQSPLSKISGWVDTFCPICGGKARRETDTMPNWAGSDWYFLRYIDPDNKKVLVDKELLKRWLPVDVYIGGDEHNTLHLLYSRFIYKFLFDIGEVPLEHLEPYKIRMSHGVILGPDNQRMSKSRGNVIVPEVVADKFGVDVIRFCLMFMGPFDGTMAWNEKTLVGIRRFVDKFVKEEHCVRVGNEQAKRKLALTIKKVSEDIKGFRFNTAIAAIMELLNDLNSISKGDWTHLLDKEDYKSVLKLVAPFAPYLSEELWSQIKGENDSISIHRADWPLTEEKYLENEMVKLPVAINGKTKVVLEIEKAIAMDIERLMVMVKNNDKVKVYLSQKKIIKEIVVPGKMINFVIS